MFSMKFLACLYDGTCRKFHVDVFAENIEEGKSKVKTLLTSDLSIKDYQLQVQFISSSEIPK